MAQFSFCVALWEGLHGELPFPASSLAGLRAAVLAGRPREPADTRGVPGWIRSVLDRGLARDPAARYPSMSALVRDLDRDPALRRRRALAVGTMLVVAIGAGLGLAELRARDAPPSCVTVEEASAAMWSATRREQTRRGVFAAAGSAAAETWSLLEPRLDAHAHGIATMRSEACASHRRGLHSDALYDLRIACLARREAGFAHLVELLAASDAEAVLHATKAVAELPALSACADAEALTSERAPPEDPRAAARVAELRQELARAQAEESAGKYAAAESRAAAVEAAASPLGYAPLVAEATLRWGSASMQQGDADTSARLDAALWTALKAEHRSVAAEAAAKRIYARLEIDDRSADVSEAIALAESLVERAGASDWRTRWVLANNTAIAWERRGELSRALVVYTQALGLVPAGDDAVYERAATLQNMAPLQLRSGERAAGEQAARSAVDEFRALYGSEHPSTASAEAVLAIVLARLGHHAEAAALTEAAIGRAAEPRRPPPWMLLQAARLALLRRDHAGGLGWCARAEPQLTLPDGTRSPWSLPFAAVRARIAARTGDPQALEILDQVAGGAPTSGSSFVMLERAEILWEIGQRDAAEAIVQALVAEDNVAESEEEGVRLLLARALVARGALVAGMSLLHTLLGEREGVGLQEPERRALALRTLAEAEAAAGHPQEAASRAREALLVLADFDEDSAALVDARRTAAELAARE